MSALLWTIDRKTRGLPMATAEHDLQKHDDWALAAVTRVQEMTAEQQNSFLVRVFRAVAHYDLTLDAEVAMRLCHDIHSTIELQSDLEYAKSERLLAAPQKPDVSIEDAIERLEAM